MLTQSGLSVIGPFIAISHLFNLRLEPLIEDNIQNNEAISLNFVYLLMMNTHVTKHVKTLECASNSEWGTP